MGWQKQRGWLALLLLVCGSIGILLWPTADQPTVRGQTDNKDEILYLSADGIIRVYELAEPRDAAVVNWSSPEADGAWQEFAVGDLNGDGDDEIVAIRNQPSAGIDLAIYDPVIARGTNVDPDTVAFIDSVPWRTLHTADMPGELALVAVGQFDLTTPGEEIFLSYSVTDSSEPPNSLPSGRYIQLYRRAVGDSDGMQWATLIPPVETEIRWQTVDVGDVNQDGVDEIVLTGDDGYLHVYRIDGATLREWVINESGTRPWNDAAIGQFLPGGPAEVAAVRNASGQLPRFWIFEFDPGEESSFRDGRAEYFAPSPNFVFFADINSNNDDEAFLLRDSIEVPPAPTPSPAPRPHLIMRNEGGDELPAFEIVLDADNGYQAGVGGDLDNDGRAEIVVARPDRLRIFTQPESTVANQPNTTSVEYLTSTNARTVRVGNLDSQGVLAFPVFVSTPADGVNLTLPSGQSSVTQLSLGLENSALTLPFTVTINNQPNWITSFTATPPTVSRAAPASIQLALSAYGLEPFRRYETVLVVIAPNTAPVRNTPFSIPVALEVGPGLWPRPGSIFAYVDCEEAEPPIIARELVIDGLLGVPFTAQIIGDATNWITYTSALEYNNLPTLLDLTIDPARRPSGAEPWRGEIQINADNNQGEPQEIRVPITLLCLNTSLHLPLIGNGPS